MFRLDGVAVYPISQPANVGAVNLCLPPYSDCTACLSEPSRAPGRLRARSVSASEVEVTWKPLAWSNSRRRILGYEVNPTHVYITCQHGQILYKCSAKCQQLVNNDHLCYCPYSYLSINKGKYYCWHEAFEDSCQMQL